MIKVLRFMLSKFEPELGIILGPVLMLGGVTLGVFRSFLDEQYGQGPVITSTDGRIMTYGLIAGVAVIVATFVLIVARLLICGAEDESSKT